MCDILDIPDLEANDKYYENKQLNIFGIRFNLSNKSDLADLQKKFGINVDPEELTSDDEYKQNIKKNHLFLYMFCNISKYNLDDQLKCIETRCSKFIREKSNTEKSNTQLQNVKKALQTYIDSNTDIIKYHSNTISEHWRFTVFTYVQKLIYKIDMWIKGDAVPEINASILASGAGAGAGAGVSLPPSLTLRLNVNKVFSFINFIKTKKRDANYNGINHINISQENINKLTNKLKNNSPVATSGNNRNNDNMSLVNLNDNSKEYYIYVVDKILKDSMPALYDKTSQIITGGFRAEDSTHNIILQTHQCDEKKGIFARGNREAFLGELQVLIDLTDKLLKTYQPGYTNIINVIPNTLVNRMVKISTTCVPLLHNFITNITKLNIAHNKEDIAILNNEPTPKDTRKKYINLYMNKDKIILLILDGMSPSTGANTWFYNVEDNTCKTLSEPERLVNTYVFKQGEYNELHPSMEFILMLFIQLSKGITPNFCDKFKPQSLPLPNLPSNTPPGTPPDTPPSIPPSIPPGTPPGFAMKAPVNLTKTVGMSPINPIK